MDCGRDYGPVTLSSTMNALADSRDGLGGGIIHGMKMVLQLVPHIAMGRNLNLSGLFFLEMKSALKLLVQNLPRDG